MILGDSVPLARPLESLHGNQWRHSTPQSVPDTISATTSGGRPIFSEDLASIVVVFIQMAGRELVLAKCLLHQALGCKTGL